MALDIEERHLLRLGHGEEALETEKDFSRLDRKFLVLETMQTQALQSIKVMNGSTKSSEMQSWIYPNIDKSFPCFNHFQIWPRKLCTSKQIRALERSSATTGQRSQMFL